jgi:hypothetical protein
MIRIYPEIECSAKCPTDGSDLKITGLTIPGMYCLADTVCPTCATSYYVHLPSGQALLSSLIVNQATADIYDPDRVNWFSEPLRQGMLQPEESELIPIVHKFFEADRIIILNCLDFLYGHSLLKLLNVQRYLDSSPDLGCCVLVPSQFVHLVPDGVAEIWEYSVPLAAASKWYPMLALWINEEISKRKECFLCPGFSHPGNRVYDLHRFVRNLPDISQEIARANPVILFSYREDRLWGKTLKQQERNLQKLYHRLNNIFPDMLFVLVGFGQQNQLKANGARLLDLRTDKFELDRDRLWMAYMSAADCAVGVHGSNMLLPSGLSKSVVDIVSLTKLENAFQDLLFDRTRQNIREVLLLYRFVYGNGILSDVRPSVVTDLVASVLSHGRLNCDWFKASEEGRVDTQYTLDDPVFKQAMTNWQYRPRPAWLIRKSAAAVARFAERLLDVVS